MSKLVCNKIIFPVKLWCSSAKLLSRHIPPASWGAGAFVGVKDLFHRVPGTSSQGPNGLVYRFVAPMVSEIYALDPFCAH
jgi:hypothetical protein